MFLLPVVYSASSFSTEDTAVNGEPELKAMKTVYDALSELDEDAKRRVIDWVIGKFALGRSKQRTDRGVIGLQPSSDTGETNLASFLSVADLFAKTSPKNESDKVLVVASYLQEAKNLSELTGREINKELTHLGHGIKNITAAINSLMNKKPKLMIQTRKEGKSQQAQKKYKVTTEGLAAAKRLIGSIEADEE